MVKKILPGMLLRQPEVRQLLLGTIRPHTFQAMSDFQTDL